ncbi:hypothetical protein HZC33_02865 [Candidatus Wolfebacteria bacterium]|nr:hypothetical protein [Candidatus Wolfebacteria bacterium]
MKNKKEIIFIVVGITLLVILIAFGFYSINFLIIKINDSFNIGAVGLEGAQRINFEGLKKIGIIKE